VPLYPVHSACDWCSEFSLEQHAWFKIASVAQPLLAVAYRDVFRHACRGNWREAGDGLSVGGEVAVSAVSSLDRRDS